jgi:YbbR domain-containing protein
MNNNDNFFKSFGKTLVSNIGVKIIALVAAIVVFVVVHVVA